MRNRELVRAPFACVLIALAAAAAVPAGAQPAAPLTYDAPTDRTPLPEPAVPVLGEAGFQFNDPTFGSRLLRVTDGHVRPGLPDRSYRSPSASHQNAWNTTSRYFYVMSTDGTVIPFTFDPVTMAAARIQPAATGNGGLTLNFRGEPQFSHVSESYIYGIHRNSTLRTIYQYDFATGAYSLLLDLDTLSDDLANTYAGGLSSSSGPVEKICVFYGGASQDKHFRVVLFEKEDPSRRRVLDSLTSTIDGVPTSTVLDFKLHHVWVDRSGRYVLLSTTGADRQAPRYAAPHYLWDTVTDVITPLAAKETLSGGHNSLGFDAMVNHDCCTTTTWDAAQWQFRTLAAPLTKHDVVNPVLTPKEVYLSEHTSWNNARPDRLAPFLASTYRYGNNTIEWRAWDDEIIAVQTDLAAGTLVWRFGHHRSNVASDADPLRTNFWYMPRVNVAQDGRWAIFTSNWEKTLGTDAGSSSGDYRQDVFVIELASTPPVEIVTDTLAAGMETFPYAQRFDATGGTGVYAWTVTAGALPPGIELSASGQLGGVPTTPGEWSFAVTATDAAGPRWQDTRDYTLRIDPKPNEPPVVNITSPVPGSLVAVGVTLTLQAGAADPDGVVTRVEYFVNGESVGAAASAPYAVSWQPRAAGAYSIVAAATDDDLAETASAPVAIESALFDAVIHAADAAALQGNYALEADSTAAAGLRLWNKNKWAKKVNAADAPASYAEFTFHAVAGHPYQLWIRGRAEENHWTNDSAYVQFSGTVTAAGAAVHRIGTTDALSYTLEDCDGCGVSAWGWQDTAYTKLAAPLYFATTGLQTVRLQPREDGLSIDQIVLSPERFLTTAPGTLKNDTTILPPWSPIIEPEPEPDPTPAPAPALAEVVLHASAAAVTGDWKIVDDSTAASGRRLSNPNRWAPRVTSASASPASYAELTFTADAGVAYRLWLRGKGAENHWTNDSTYVQFSDTVDAAGNAAWRIGTTSSTTVELEECDGCGISEWGWQDNASGTGMLGPVVQFATSGTHTIRLQTREDGFSIDQIVLSAVRYLTTAPGALKDDTTILEQ